MSYHNIYIYIYIAPGEAQDAGAEPGGDQVRDQGPEPQCMVVLG